jgi:exoribonuclease-2
VNTQSEPNKLEGISRSAMRAHGLEPDFSAEALRQLDQIVAPAGKEAVKILGDSVQNLSHLLWCSIDNDDSRDLDQLSAAEAQTDGSVKVWVAIADVDILVPLKSPLDQHAQLNTVTVYTGVKTFYLLPEKLSTNFTSLVQDQERVAVVTEMRIGEDGKSSDERVFLAVVCNKAKLAYSSVSEWLEGRAPLPPVAAQVSGMDAHLKLQDSVAQHLRKLRFQNGALDFENSETVPVMENGMVTDLRRTTKTRAGQLIEDLMIQTNSVNAKFLKSRGSPSVRRVVRTPERWSRIVELAHERGTTLPDVADPKALSEFMANAKAKNPDQYPELSLSIVKLLGRGEYVLDLPGEESIGHFGLAVHDYSHSTAPNRRFPDLVTQRLLKNSILNHPSPYTNAELTEIASHCTEQENAADRVERQVRKSIAASLLSSHIGTQYDAIVTGASEKGTWVRTTQPVVEGRVVHGSSGLDVGNRVRVTLRSVNIDKGFIDFEASRAN